MKAVLGGVCLLVLAGTGLAHRLDEYLQATRIAVSSSRIELAFALTPGVAVAGQVLPHLDGNRDGQVSTAEARAYARRFLQDLVIGLDGKPVTLEAPEVAVPDLAELREGVGVIRIRTALAMGSLASGGHSLTLTNRHLPGLSVHLVNALQPYDPAVHLGRQLRDELQTGYRLDFQVGPGAR